MPTSGAEELAPRQRWPWKEANMRLHHTPDPAVSSETTADMEDLIDRMHAHDRIAQRAYELFRFHGSQPDVDAVDWIKAEMQQGWLTRSA